MCRCMDVWAEGTWHEEVDEGIWEAVAAFAATKEEEGLRNIVYEEQLPPVVGFFYYY